MNLLILKGFNNYFNRKIKKYSDLDDYKTNSSKYYSFSDINFNPNDGVITEQVLGSENQKDSGNLLDWENDGSPDYIVCYKTVPGTIIVDGEEVETAVDVVVSRWFVTESVRTRAGQYKIALKRDVIADHLEQILTNPCFVEKGYVEANNQALIFADEGCALNEIKQAPEYQLFDETGIPWIVLYIGKDWKGNTPAQANPTKLSEWNDQIPIFGKSLLNTAGYIDSSDLPWDNIVPVSPTSGKVYKMKAASQFLLKPISAYEGYVDHYSIPAWTNSYRTILPYNYTGGQWVLANSARVERIGNSQNDNELRLGDIGLTPASTGIVRTNTGASGIPTASPSNYDNTYSSATAILNSQRLGTTTATQKTNLQSWFNTNSGYISGTTTGENVDSTTYMYDGGNQSFVPQSVISSYNQKLVKIGSYYYRMTVTLGEYTVTHLTYWTKTGNTYSTTRNSKFSSMSNTNSLKNYLVNPSQSGFRLNSDNTMVEVDMVSWSFNVKYDRVQSKVERFTLPLTNSRNQTENAPYDILAFPYGPFKVRLENDSGQSPTNLLFDKDMSKDSLGIARAIATAGAGNNGFVYDVQLLPYCPSRELAQAYAEEGCWNLGTASGDYNASSFLSSEWSGVYEVPNDIVDTTNASYQAPKRANLTTIGIWCSSSSGTFDITSARVGINGSVVPFSELFALPEGSIETKLYNASKKFRLVSPNYAGIFEFNPLKNKGVTAFNVDYTYKPYNPYIHIAPFFNIDGLYGADTNDARGLILQGDFSVGYVSDSWVQYQIQNANYDNIFNRQIQNIDSMQQLEREQTRTQYWTNIATEGLGLGGGLKGASAAPPGWGTLIGGIAGTVGGTGGAIAGAALDERWMNWSQQEARSYAIDMYNLNLETVKAKPDSLAKTDALNANYKFVPFVEVYDCTETEKEIFRNKLKYDGMSVGAIGTLENYIPAEGPGWDFQMLKGRMIMAENITDDFHIVDAIYQEVLKGFYYVNQYTEPEGE